MQYEHEKGKDYESQDELLNFNNALKSGTSKKSIKEEMSDTTVISEFQPNYLKTNTIKTTTKDPSINSHMFKPQEVPLRGKQTLETSETTTIYELQEESTTKNEEEMSNISFINELQAEYSKDTTNSYTTTMNDPQGESTTTSEEEKITTTYVNELQTEYGKENTIEVGSSMKTTTENMVDMYEEEYLKYSTMGMDMNTFKSQDESFMESAPDKLSDLFTKPSNEIKETSTIFEDIYYMDSYTTDMSAHAVILEHKEKPSLDSNITKVGLVNESEIKEKETSTDESSMHSATQDISMTTNMYNQYSTESATVEISDGTNEYNEVNETDNTTKEKMAPNDTNEPKIKHYQTTEETNKNKNNFKLQERYINDETTEKNSKITKQDIEKEDLMDNIAALPKVKLIENQQERITTNSIEPQEANENSIEYIITTNEENRRTTTEIYEFEEVYETENTKEYYEPNNRSTQSSTGQKMISTTVNEEHTTENTKYMNATTEFYRPQEISTSDSTAEDLGFSYTLHPDIDLKENHVPKRVSSNEIPSEDLSSIVASLADLDQIEDIKRIEKFLQSMLLCKGKR